MTQEQIIWNNIESGNRLIAEFMGYNTIYGEKPFVPFYKPYGITDEEYESEVRDAQGKLMQWEYHNQLQYHSSWDWLMPVVEKIRDFKVYDGDRLAIMSSVSVYIKSFGYEWACSILGSITICHNKNIPHTYTEIKMPYVSCKGEKLSSPPIEPAWQAVTEFIKWYNSQLITPL